MISDPNICAVCGRAGTMGPGYCSYAHMPGVCAPAPVSTPFRKRVRLRPDVPCPDLIHGVIYNAEVLRPGGGTQFYRIDGKIFFVSAFEIVLGSGEAAPVQALSRECACGIARVDCTYHKPQQLTRL